VHKNALIARKNIFKKSNPLGASMRGLDAFDVSALSRPNVKSWIRPWMHLLHWYNNNKVSYRKQIAHHHSWLAL